jgi:hypothetical protein
MVDGATHKALHRRFADRLVHRAVAAQDLVGRQAAVAMLDPRPVEALPCGSRSITRTFSPMAASAVPRLMAVVVFPPRPSGSPARAHAAISGSMLIATTPSWLLGRAEIFEKRSIRLKGSTTLSFSTRSNCQEAEASLTSRENPDLCGKRPLLPGAVNGSDKLKKQVQRRQRAGGDRIHRVRGPPFRNRFDPAGVHRPFDPVSRSAVRRKAALR